MLDGEDVPNSAGVGGAAVGISNEDGKARGYVYSHYSPFDEPIATFAYYDPYVPPTLLRIETPTFPWRSWLKAADCPG